MLRASHILPKIEKGECVVSERAGGEEIIFDSSFRSLEFRPIPLKV